MTIKNYLKRKIIKLTGVWIERRKDLPVGTNLIEDLKNKLGIEFNIIFDVGANIGQTALEFSRSFPSAKIYSFEPIGMAYEQLLKNIKGISNVETIKIAFSDKEENVEVRLFDDNMSSLNSLKQAVMNPDINSPKEIVSTITLDSYIADKGIHNIDLLKIDTEGYEMQVLKGALKSLRKGIVKAIYLEVGFSRENERNTYLTTVHEFMQDEGFTFLGLYSVCHIPLRNKGHFGNALYLHNDYLTRVKHPNP